MHLEIDASDRIELDRSFSKVIDYLRERFIGSKLPRDFFSYILNELEANILEHAQAKTAIAEVIDVAQGVEVRIKDDGIGIPASLKKRYPDLDEGQAVSEALRGLSSKSEERGYGLRTSNKLVQKAGGDTRFVSGSNGTAITFSIHMPEEMKLSQDEFSDIIQGR